MQNAINADTILKAVPQKTATGNPAVPVSQAEAESEGSGEFEGVFLGEDLDTRAEDVPETALMQVLPPEDKAPIAMPERLISVAASEGGHTLTDQEHDLVVRSSQLDTGVLPGSLDLREAEPRGGVITQLPPDVPGGPAMSSGTERGKQALISAEAISAQKDQTVIPEGNRSEGKTDALPTPSPGWGDEGRGTQQTTSDSRVPFSEAMQLAGIRRQPVEDAAQNGVPGRAHETHSAAIWSGRDTLKNPPLVRHSLPEVALPRTTRQGAAETRKSLDANTAVRSAIVRTDTDGAEGLTQATTAHSSPAVREPVSGQIAPKAEPASLAANGNPGTAASEPVSLHTSLAADASEKGLVEMRSGTSNDAGKLWSLVVGGTERFASTRTGPVPQPEPVMTGQAVAPALVLEPAFASVEMTTANDEMAVAGGEQVGTSRGATPASITTLPQQDGTAQFARISQQLMEVAVRHSDGPVELMLSPEELGRVRMNFLLQDGALTVTVAAERGETLALIRRNIDILLQDFQDVGLSGVNLEFVEQDPGGQQDGFSDARGETPDNQSDALPVADTEKQSPVRINAMTGARTGLDLRL